MKNHHNFAAPFQKLLKLNIAQYLSLNDADEVKLSNEEIHTLISYASIFSLSENVSDITFSYEICSRLIESFGASNVYVAACADAILSRIGNFPGRSLLREKYIEDEAPVIPFALSVERIAREVENSLDSGEIVTDFQLRLFESLSTETSLSVSAPTSAGKSFILNLDLVRKLRQKNEQCIIYIVPTRALVSEVVTRVRNTLRSEMLDDVVVRTAPFLVPVESNHKGVVYVLTQERLLSLLANANANERLNISLLIIDEAHELQKGKRGILLQNAVDLALHRSPNASIFFASPLIKNPGYILSLFSRQYNGTFFTEEISPVSQNVILISELKGKSKEVSVSLLVPEGTVHIGTANIGYSFRGSKIIQKAKFANEICLPGESAIVFVDSAFKAEESALCAASITKNFEATDEILDFIHFIEDEVHPEYPLIECLKSGVACHYGDMPSIIRTGVERLFRENKIRILCSTSTLLQGVNLPAKHIVIEDPHLGTDPMLRADFRNLAGRAGRLLKEFHGNIWCLRPAEWAVASYQGENLQEIQSAMAKLMEDGGTLIHARIDGATEERDRDLADAAYSRLYHEVNSGPTGAVVTYYSYSNPGNSVELSKNIEHMTSLNIDVPPTVLHAHRSLRPDMLQKLYASLREIDDIKEIILINPYEQGGKNRMDIAISLIHSAFGIEMSEKYKNWISRLAHQWIWSKSIGELILNRVEFKRQENNDAPASPIIRNLLNVLEKEIRYSLVKYFSAYEDLLKLVLIEKNHKEESEKVAPYHIYLEFGSCDQIALSLMALGLSRFTAIKLKDALNWEQGKEPEDYLAILAKAKFSSLSLPILCKNEIQDLLGIN
jgi:hypothetical protein